MTLGIRISFTSSTSAIMFPSPRSPRLNWFLFVFIALPVLIGCQAPGPQNRVGLDMSTPSSDLGQWKALDSALNRAVLENTLPGAVLLTARDGRVVVHKAYGHANPITGKKMDTSSLFRICSQSKAITATAALILWEKGALELDDPVSKYIPEFAETGILDSVYADSSFSTLPNPTPLTIRHLMTHTSGLPYGEIGDPRFEKLYAQADVVDLFPRDGRSTLDNAKKLGNLALIHAPGQRWNYSLGLDVLVAVIEVASGRPYAAFVEEELFLPLGMTNTHFTVPQSDRPRLTEVMTPADSPSGWKPHTHPVYTTDYPRHPEWPLCSGGAGLTSTAEDYARFLQMHLDGGLGPNGRLLRKATIDTIMADHAAGLLDGPWRQGLAFGVKHSEPGTGRFFWSGYFNTQYFADPTTQELTVLMKQTYGLQHDPSSGPFGALLWN